MEEKEIDLIDLIADMLSHWKGMVVCMLIGAVLLGGFSYKQSLDAAEAARMEEESIREQAGDKAPQTIKLEQAEKLLTETQKAMVLMAMDDLRELISREQYTEVSILMSMDAYNVSRIELVYKLAEEDMRDSYMLGSVYEDMLNGVGLYEYVKEQTGIPAAALREIITIDAKSNMDISSETQRIIAGNDSMKVVIIHADAKQCRQLADTVKIYIESLQAQLADSMGAHDVILLSENAGTIMDIDVLNKQINNRNTCINLQLNIAKIVDSYTPEQKNYYELLKNPEKEIVVQPTDSTEEEVLIEVPEPSVSMKYVVVGGVLFAFLYAALWFALYIMNGKLRTNDELQNIYHIAQLGLVVKEPQKKFVVDQWITQLRNHGKRTFTREQSLELAATAVKISAVKNELKEVCLMGCDLSAGADEVCNRLKVALEGEQIKVTVLNNVLYDAAAMEQLESAQGVVLVEKAGVTMYREITEELELVGRQGIKVLGAIVVE